MYRLKLNELGRQVFKWTPDRKGIWLGESHQQYRPNVMQLPRWRVHWDRSKRPSTVLKSYVEFDGDTPPGI